jgi:hypothetical protein
MSDMDHSNRSTHPWARWYGPAVGLFATLMVLAVWAGSWISAPFALAFVGAAYLWSLGISPDAPAEGPCAGCAAGCVGCRERIDSPITGLR